VIVEEELQRPVDCSDLEGCDFQAAQAELRRLRELLYKYSTCDKAVDASDVESRAEAITEVTAIRAALRLQTAAMQRTARPGAIYFDSVESTHQPQAQQPAEHDEGKSGKTSADGSRK